MTGEIIWGLFSKRDVGKIDGSLKIRRKILKKDRRLHNSFIVSRSVLKTQV